MRKKPSRLTKHSSFLVKTPRVSLSSAESHSKSTKSQDEISLESKARILLAATKKLTDIFVPCFSSEDRQQEFLESMGFYAKRCRAVDKASFKVIQQSDSEAALKARDSSKIRLEYALEKFDDEILRFFDDCDSLAQEQILKELKTIIASVVEKKLKAFLKSIENQLQKSRRIQTFSGTYNPGVDLLLGTWLIAQTIKEERGDKKPMLDNEVKRNSSVSTRRKSHARSSQKKAEKVDLFSAIPEEDIYQAIQIDDTLFLNEQAKPFFIKKGFEELFNVESGFVELLKSIKQELGHIKELQITKQDKKLIAEFLMNIELLLSLQVELSDNLQRHYAVLNLEDSDTCSRNAIDCLLAVYDKSMLEKQKEYFVSSIKYWSEMDKLLLRNQKKCESIRAQLPSITGQLINYKLESQPAQKYTRRILPCQEIFRASTFDDKKPSDAVRNLYQRICYIPKLYNIVLTLEQSGYMPPAGFRQAMEGLNFDREYSLTYILINPECDSTKCSRMVKEHFISFLYKQDGKADTVDFFKQIYAALSKPTPSLQELELLRRYFEEDNPLGLNKDRLHAVAAAFDSEELSPILKLKCVMAALMPVLKQVHDDLNNSLRVFKFSYDMIELLFEIPDIESKLGGIRTLSTLSRSDINGLLPFWIEIFVHQDSALVSFFEYKKALFKSSDQIPDIVAAAIDGCAYTQVEDKKKQMKTTEEFYQEIVTAFNEPSQRDDNMRVIAAEVLKTLIAHQFHKQAREYTEEKSLFLTNCYQRILEEKKTIIAAIEKIVAKENLPKLFDDCQKKEDVSYTVYERTPVNIFCEEAKRVFSDQVEKELNKQMRRTEQEQFFKVRNTVAATMLEKEIERQIELIKKADIFYDTFLTELEIRKEEICRALLTKFCSQKDDGLFFSSYANTLLDVPLYLMDILKSNFTEARISNQTIFSYSFKLNPDDTDLGSESLTKILAEEIEFYDQKNRSYLKEMQSLRSFYPLFNFLKEKTTPVSYSRIKARISELNQHKKNPSKAGRNIVAKTPAKTNLLQPDGRPVAAGDIDVLSTPSPASTLSSTSPVGFERLIETIENKIKNEVAQWSMEKYVKVRDDLTEEDILVDCNDTACCNFIEVYDRKDDGLIFTAEKTEGNPTARHSTSLPTKETCIIKNYRHEHDEVTMVVSAMAKSAPLLESVSPGARRILKINLTASPEDELTLIAEYVGVALDQGFFPKVTLNDDVPLTPAALYDKLKQYDKLKPQDPSLAATYNKELKQQKKIYLGLKKQGFFSGAPGGPSLGRKPVGKKQDLASSSVSRVLSFRMAHNRPNESKYHYP